jgi:phosphopantothenoylcysteine decarboxylase
VSEAHGQDPGRVLYLIVCAAPPAVAIADLVGLIMRAGWSVCVIPTPRAAGWLDADALVRRTGFPVRHEYRTAGDVGTLPKPDAIALVPATFNTINKWAAGVSDTFALGVLNEAIGLRMPILVAPYAKPSLVAHPVFAESLSRLRTWGAVVLPRDAIRNVAGSVTADGPVFDWQAVIDAISGL